MTDSARMSRSAMAPIGPMIFRGSSWTLRERNVPTIGAPKFQ